MKLNNFYLNNLNMTEQKNEEILPNDWSDLDNHPIGISLKETLSSQNNISLFVIIKIKTKKYFIIIDNKKFK